MKKAIFTLLLFIVAFATTYGQHCTATTNTVKFDTTRKTPGFYPSYDSLPCMVVNKPVNDTIYFVNFPYFSISSFTINFDSLRIDSIGNLPPGLCWTSNRVRNTYLPSDTGVIIVSGTPTGGKAQYQLDIALTVFSNNPALAPFGTPPRFHSHDVRKTAHVWYLMRVKCNANDPCPAVDRGDTTVTAYKYKLITNTGTCTSGINEVATELSDIHIQPNPMNSSAKIHFTSTVDGDYTLRMTSLIGTEVMHKSLPVIHGENTIDIERGNLSSGLYLFTIGNSTGSVTRKITIE